MIIVSDTSPLNYLVLVDVVEVLPKLFGEVHVPVQVMQELRHPHAPSQVSNWAFTPPEWLRIQTLTDMPIDDRLDPGEACAIALAQQLKAEAILIDERQGRLIAKEHGLATIGTITVLELAAEQDLIDLPSAFAALRQTTFRITDVLIEAALQRDADRRKN